MDTQKIQAAGAVLWRESDDDVIEVALIHRPKYMDWSLPKGKLNRGESHIAAAFREVLEETGYKSKFGPFLGVVKYTSDDVAKEVYFWSAKSYKLPETSPSADEVDELRWVAPIEAKNLLTNQSDKEIIDKFLEIGAKTQTLILLRHAKALSRDEWEKDDEDRPLDQTGQIQAKNLPQYFIPFMLDQICSSDAMRCAETVLPLSQAIGRPITYVSDLSEYAFYKNKSAAYDYIKELIESEGTHLVCSHNPILSKIAEKLIGKKSFKSLKTELAPGDAIVIHFRDGDAVALDWINAPSNLAI
jgi:8-oxo-dGTP diphosphatase